MNVVTQTIDSALQTIAVEDQINRGALSREELLEQKMCHIIEPDRNTAPAFANLRRGYPYLPFDEQCQGSEFRESAQAIMQKIAEYTLAHIPNHHAVIVVPWRAGLGFWEAYQIVGHEDFYHISTKRDEVTLLPAVDYEYGTIRSDEYVVVADPMLATGNTLVDIVQRVIHAGVPAHRIFINAVVAAPVGVTRIAETFPGIRIILGALDTKLDHRGYIVPGLGDFGDKYFSDMKEVDFRILVGSLDLPLEGKDWLLERLARQANTKQVN